VVCKHRRVDSTGELAQFGKCSLDLSLRLVEQELRLRVGRWSEELEGHSDPEQPLLGAVVEVALEPAALLVARPHDPRSRLSDLGELHAELCVQALVLEREPRRRADRLEQRRLVEKDRIVDDRGQVGADVGDRSVIAGGEVDGTPGLVHPLLSLGQPQCELQARVADRPRERVSHVAGTGAAQLDDEVADRPARPACDGEPDEGGDCARQHPGYP
jgi:hypothetical protein